jgi:23S rRNA pseudouridine1911/1915/1917 synthase
MNTPTILYEDNHVLVAVKPAGILSQEDATGAPDMLTLLKKYLCTTKNKPGDAYLGLLHRLDRPVSGVMVFAKTSKCASRISAQIREHKTDKKYRAVVQGIPDQDEDTLHSYILKDEDKNQVTIIHGDTTGISPAHAKEAILTYKKMGTAIWEKQGTDRNLALLEVHLITGRSHQIRAQLADAGFPILGDRKYGLDDPVYRGEICLESFSFSFFHPVTGVKMTFEIPLSNEVPWNLFRKETIESEEII